MMKTEFSDAAWPQVMLYCHPGHPPMETIGLSTEVKSVRDNVQGLLRDSRLAFSVRVPDNVPIGL